MKTRTWTVLTNSIAAASLALLGSLVLGCAAEGDSDSDQVVGDLPTIDQDEGKADSLSSNASDRLVDIPFYFGVPKGSISTALNRSQYVYPTVWNPSDELEDVGLRMIAVKQATTKLEDKIAARHGMAASLAKAGVLQDGDIALTFRPELADTMAYPHIQMGSTHAGLVYTDGGEAFNLDSPLDSEYVGQFDTKHYAGDGGAEAGVTALHILRPRVMNETRRTQLRGWVSTLKDNLSEINGERAQLRFQSDYMTPIFVSTGLTTRQTVTKLGQIILEDDTTTKLPMYCAEFAWHMIALSNCTDEDIRSAPQEGAACVDAPFAPMPLVATTTGEVGLAEGPLLALLQAPVDGRAALVTEVFAEGTPSKLSSGHRAVAEQVAPLMAGLEQFFQARAAGATPEQAAAAGAQLNAAVQPNYSPTAFMVHAMPAADRSVEYVATVAFVSPAGYEKAKVLSQNPVP
jgi:hypothetical protein